LKECKKSTYYEYMGNLKGHLFIGQSNSKGKISHETLLPVNITSEELRFRLENFRTDISQTTNLQVTDNSLTRVTDKKTVESYTCAGSESISTTRHSNYDKSKQVDKNQVTPTCAITMEEQTNKEWLDDYARSTQDYHLH
jgi:hypothetical protein